MGLIVKGGGLGKCLSFSLFLKHDSSLSFPIFSFGLGQVNDMIMIDIQVVLICFPCFLSYLLFVMIYQFIPLLMISG